MVTKARRLRLQDYEFLNEVRYRKYRRPERSSSRARFVVLGFTVLLFALVLCV